LAITLENPGQDRVEPGMELREPLGAEVQTTFLGQAEPIPGGRGRCRRTPRIGRHRAELVEPLSIVRLGPLRFVQPAGEEIIHGRNPRRAVRAEARTLDRSQAGKGQKVIQWVRPDLPMVEDIALRRSDLVHGIREPIHQRNPCHVRPANPPATGFQDALRTQYDRLEPRWVEVFNNAAGAPQEATFVVPGHEKADPRPSASDPACLSREMPIKDRSELLLQPPIALSVVRQMEGRDEPIDGHGPPVQCQRHPQKGVQSSRQQVPISLHFLCVLKDYRAEARGT
jgi:hypothetical protein